MKFLFYILFFALVSCSSKEKKEDAAIYLPDLRTGAIPDSVFQKDNLVTLHIGCEGYTLYPPLSALSDKPVPFPVEELPERIGELTGLRTLIITCSNIKKLPESIIKLKKLETLNLAMNRNLNIFTELEKIKQLHRLKKLMIAATNTPQDQFEAIRKQLKNVEVL